jgi:hypothetical protein
MRTATVIETDPIAHSMVYSGHMVEPLGVSSLSVWKLCAVRILLLQRIMLLSEVQNSNRPHAT